MQPALKTKTHTQDNFSLILWNKELPANYIILCFEPVIQYRQPCLGNLGLVHQTTNTAKRLIVEQQGPGASQEQTQKKFDLKIAAF